MNKFMDVLRQWFPFAVAISLMCGVIYIVMQQSYRHGANDPQFQMAEDAAHALGKGAAPKALVSSMPFELSGSLAPYLIIYDENGDIAASGIVLDSKEPKVPKGIFDRVKNIGEEAVTWQPLPGVRQALVVKRTETGNLYYVVAGRSLLKVEARIDMLSKLTVAGWLGSLGVLFVSLWAFKMIMPE